MGGEVGGAFLKGHVIYNRGFIDSFLFRNVRFVSLLFSGDACQSTPPVPKNAEDKHDSNAQRRACRPLLRLLCGGEDFEGGQSCRVCAGPVVPVRSSS